MMMLLESIRLISATLLINLGFDSNSIRASGFSYEGVPIPKRLAYRFFVVSFILWILYIILGKDPEIKAKLKRIVLFAYFVPMILFSLFNYSDSIIEHNMTGEYLNIIEHLLDICLSILQGGAWPFIILAKTYTEKTAKEKALESQAQEDKLAGDYELRDDEFVKDGEIVKDDGEVP